MIINTLNHMQVSHFWLKVSNNGIYKRFKAILSQK